MSYLDVLNITGMTVEYRLQDIQMLHVMSFLMDIVRYWTILFFVYRGVSFFSVLVQYQFWKNIRLNNMINHRKLKQYCSKNRPSRVPLSKLCLLVQFLVKPTKGHFLSKNQPCPCKFSCDVHISFAIPGQYTTTPPFLCHCQFVVYSFTCCHVNQ